jgi:cytochrome c
MARIASFVLPGLALIMYATMYATAPLARTESRDPQVAYNNACRTCHSMREGDHRLGPSLQGVVGRKAGSVEGFQFSSAMKGSNIVWDEQNLDEFIANPDKVVHGNAMKPYGGIDDAEQRKEIVAYLKSISQ